MFHFHLRCIIEGPGSFRGTSVGHAYLATAPSTVSLLSEPHLQLSLDGTPRRPNSLREIPSAGLWCISVTPPAAYHGTTLSERTSRSQKSCDTGCIFHSQIEEESTR